VRDGLLGLRPILPKFPPPEKPMIPPAKNNRPDDLYGTASGSCACPVPRASAHQEA